MRSNLSDQINGQIEDSLYSDHPTFTAVKTIISQLDVLEDLQMTARLRPFAQFGSEVPTFNFFLDEGRVLVFGIRCLDRIFLRFSTKTDVPLGL